MDRLVTARTLTRSNVSELRADPHAHAVNRAEHAVLTAESSRKRHRSPSSPEEKSKKNKTGKDSDSTPNQSTTVSIPLLNDSEDRVLSKWNAILNALHSGQSIAEATAYSATPNPSRKAVAVAESQMTPLESMGWDSFNNNKLFRLPEFDWTNNRSPPPPSTSKKSLKEARRRVEALNRLYKTDSADAGHIAWITPNMVEFLPLIKAVARVIGAERDLAGGGRRLAELQIVNRILSVSGQICKRTKSSVVRSRGGEVQALLGYYRRRLA